jgi:ribosomal protein S18 acetylase RimI-like enzyme
MGSQEHGVAVLEKDFDPELAIVALRQGQLAGLAGLQYGGRRFINFRVHALYRAVTRRQRRGQLLMNGIAVDAALRGQEVGTRLLQAVFDLAQDNGFDSIRLDVVDTNPGARRLYERMGYENN